MQCVILAGGLGTRMWPKARLVPKHLLPVARRPFADWQLSWLAGAGVESVVYCIGYLGHMVREFVGDGQEWGIRVHYVDEGDELRGTAGALALAAQQKVLDDRFLVLYGDSLLQISPREVHDAAVASDTPALMTVFENADMWDTSNVVFEGGLVTTYAKNLLQRPPEMRWIDYGLSVLTREVIEERVPPKGHHDLAPVLEELASERLLAGFAAQERFYEIGSPTGLLEAEDLLRSSWTEP